MRWAFLLLAVLLLCYLVSCSSNPCEPDDSNAELKARLAQTPRVNAEAEAMALWLSGKLVAPQELYLEIDSVLSRLRSSFRDSIPEVDSVGFRLAKQPSTIMIGLMDWVAEAYENGEYTAWDSLNDLYRLESLSLRDYDYSGHDYALLTFEGLLDPDSLVDIYSGLPGSRWVDDNPYAGDWSVFVPRRIDNELTFLLRRGWGDCLAGCIYNEFWYFRVRAEEIEFVGSFVYDWETDPPEWWSEACLTLCRYRSGEHSDCSFCP